APQAGNQGALVSTTAFDKYVLHVEYIVKEGEKPILRFGCDAKGNSGHKHELPFGGRGWIYLTATVEAESLNIEHESRGLISAFRSRRKTVGKSSRGHIGLAGNGVVFRNIRLKPIGTQPLFNGKDLTGWKEFPGRKSTFSVTKEGWLNIKNGP